MIEKLCGRCKVVKSASDFNKAARGTNGLQSFCKPCMSEQAKVRRDAKKLYMDVYNKKWNAANVDKVRVYTVEHNANGVGAELRADNRAKELGVFVEHIDRKAIWGRDEGCCRRCGIYVAFEDFHMDHIVPYALGGVHAYYNVQTTCPSCNLAKAQNLEPVKI